MSLDLGPVRAIAASAGGEPGLADIVCRGDDVDRFWGVLRQGSILLNEPRRMGKTSLLRLLAAAPPPYATILRTSVQGASTTAEFVEHLIRDIDGGTFLVAARHSVASFLQRVESAGAAGMTVKLREAYAKRPLDTLESVIRAVSEEMQHSGRAFIVALDEFPDLLEGVFRCEGPDAAAALLGTLRRLRERHPGVRWLLTGSVGLHHVLRRLPSGDDYVIDLIATPLEPFSPPSAVWFARCLLLGAGLPDNIVLAEELASITDGIPYLLHLLISKARDLRRTGSPPATTADLYVRAVSDLDHAHPTSHLLSRVEQHYGNDRKLAEQILDLVAETPRTRAELILVGVTADDAQLRQILELLERDHYLRKASGGAYSWRYPSLRGIWQLRRA